MDVGFSFSVLSVGHGDCILIQGGFDGQHRNILIDGGPAKAYTYRNRSGELKKALQKIKDEEQRIDLLILTHVDDDHIGGLLAGFKNGGLLEQLTDKVWFNSGKLIFEHFDHEYDDTNLLDFEQLRTGTAIDNQTSIRQGVKFEEYISRRGIWQHDVILAGQVNELFGIKFTMLSPNEENLEKLLFKWQREQPDSLTSSADTDYDKTFNELLENDKFKEDNSVHNGSSIAFVFEYKGKRLLFLGDAHSKVIVESLKNLNFSNTLKLKVDYVKLSHHGSQYNTSPELLCLLDCQNFIVSTDSRRHGLPNKVTLARINDQFSRTNLWFNYPEIIESKIFSQSELQQLNNEGMRFNACESPFVL